MNNPTKEKVQSMLFGWNDIRDIRKGSTFYAMVNDADRPMPTSLVAACKDQGVEVVPWSKRGDYVQAFTA